MKTMIFMLMLFLNAGLENCSATKSEPAPEAQPARAARDEALVLGLVGAGGEDVISAPATVRAGEEFQVQITTTGSGCERAGDTGVLLTENSAAVMVYDFTSATRPGVVCTMIHKRLPHTATLRFTKPGPAVIHIWGRRIGADTPVGGAPTVLEHRVLVK